MKLLTLNKDSIARILAIVVAISFFLAGLLEILDYIIIKVLLFTSFGVLLITAIGYAIKNDAKKNRLEKKFQDDSH